MSGSSSNTFDVDRYRSHFPVLNRTIEGRRLIYLDSACTALKSQGVADRLADFYANWGGCGGKRSTHLLSQQVEQWFHEARSEVASFLHADDVNEVVFTSGATAAINLVCQSFPYDKERYKVIITDLEHNAVSLPFIEAAKRGDCELIICPTQNGRIDETG
jgi:cysteine desulfurase/selenocysteine lyase